MSRSIPADGSLHGPSGSRWDAGFAPIKTNGSVSAPPAVTRSVPPNSKADRIAALLDIGAGNGRSPSKPAGAAPRTVAVGSSVTGASRDSAELVPPRAGSQPVLRPHSQSPPRPEPHGSRGGSAAPVLTPISIPPVQVDALPLAELLFRREENPSAASPLTYRETAWVVPEGTSVDAAVRLALGMFEGVRARSPMLRRASWSTWRSSTIVSRGDRVALHSRRSLGKTGRTRGKALRFAARATPR